jgi:hypothetical protein
MGLCNANNKTKEETRLKKKKKKKITYQGINFDIKGHN